MNHTIWTGINNGKRFFDSYSDIDMEVNEEAYQGDERYDFEISEDQIQEKIAEFGADFDKFCEALHGLTESDKNRVLHKNYREEIERELINDHITGNLREMVIDDWEEDCLIEVKSKYRGEE